VLDDTLKELMEDVGCDGKIDIHQWQRFPEGVKDWLDSIISAGGMKRVHIAIMLRSKGLKDATCVGWFGDDWDCSVGSPPEAIDHVSSSVPIGYAV